MKTLQTVLLAAIIIASYTLQAQVAITADGSDPNGSAMLDVQSTTKGFLPPRMTKVQMEAIANPVEGLMVYCTDCSPKTPYYYDGYNFVSVTTAIPSGMSMSSTDVYNPKTGEIWMDRNLGATQVAESSTDSNAYGYLYQWGRDTDGHQIRTSGTRNTTSSTDTPGHGDFIIGYADWRSPKNDSLWQVVDEINNPCPSGYRLPTEAEWTAEKGSWNSNNADGAFGSPLKLPVAGCRDYTNGGLLSVDTYGYYWSRTAVTNAYSRNISFNISNSTIVSDRRGYGSSVRCIKD